MTIQPEGIRPTQQAVPSTRPEPVAGQGPEAGSSFAQMVQAPAGQGVGGAKAPSQAELMQQKMPGEAPTAASLNQQMSATNDRMGNLSNMIQTPNLKVSKADQKLIMKKLPRANESIRSAAKQVGVDVGPKLVAPKDMNLMQKALLYVSDSQAKLNAASQQVSRLNSTGMLNPGDMLSLQVKINAADQDVQFCTATVGKMVDAVKTLMNIQV
jgi:hypothetical protein